VVGLVEHVPQVRRRLNNVVADPAMLFLGICGGIAVVELVRGVGRCLSRLISDQVALVVVPFAVRMALFAVIGVRLSTGLRHVAEAVKLLNSIGQ
jgi:hypothetical protein